MSGNSIVFESELPQCRVDDLFNLRPSIVVSNGKPVLIVELLEQHPQLRF